MASRDTPATRALRSAGVSFTAHEYELAADEATYGESVAMTLGVPAERLFKTLIALVDERPVVGIVPVDKRLGLKALASAAGGKRPRMSEPADAERLTGFVTGGISPFGQKRRLPFFVDASINEHELVFVSGGKRGLQVEVAPRDLIETLEAKTVEGLAT